MESIEQGIRGQYLTWGEIEGPLKDSFRHSVQLGIDVFRGSSPFDKADISLAMSGTGFEEAEEWGSGFRGVWINNTTLQIVTWVEGDLIIEDHRSSHSFVDTVERAEEFYRNH